MLQTDTLSPPLDANCLEVLATYAVREVACKAADHDTDWLDRINELPGIDAAALTSAHGLLIAEGLLKFEITGRSLGLQYQLSSRGREILTLSHHSDTADDPADNDLSDSDE